MNPMQFGVRWTTSWLVALGLGLGLTTLVTAAPLTPELQKHVRAATFEVVIRKPEKDTLVYERPLPLELIPFVERNDPYWSVGTAFAIAPNTFISAGHVMLGGVGSQLGLPLVRSARGDVYAVDHVLKFSAHEDFMVFTVQNAPPVEAFETKIDPAVDDQVFAVGNALGEGVIIRDGLLTSMTPEAQDGRWSWLRFSAATSPGNSGGPLLHASGRVIGVVMARSPNENLNYALPIDRVLNGSSRFATLDMRLPFGLPILRETTIGRLMHQFELPLSYDDFARRFQAATLNYYRKQQSRLLSEQHARVFPRGDSAEVLGTVYEAAYPSLILQQEDGSWNVESAGYIEKTELPAGGRVWTSSAGETMLFQVRRSNDAFSPGFYEDARASMDLLLKGLKLPRIIGAQAIRITSLGPAQEDTEVRDSYGRKWRLRSWSLGYADARVVTLSLPVPDGYVGMLKVALPGGFDTVAEELGLLADYSYVSYVGTLPQWSAFLARKDLLPATFDRISIEYDYASGVRYRSRRLDFDVPVDVLQLSDASVLSLRMTYMMDREKLEWDVGGIYLSQDRETKSYVGVIRQPKPAEQAGAALLTRWGQMSRRDGEFAPVRGHDAEWKQFWMRTAVSAPPSGGANMDPTAQVLYELVCGTEGIRLPRQIDDMQRELLEAIRVKER